MNKIMFSAVLSIFLAWQAGCTSSPYTQHSNISKSDSTCRVIAERLSVMKDVAAYKYAQGLPIEDRGREKKVVERFTTAVQLESLPKEYVENIIVDQIEAAKLIQNDYITGWENGRYRIEAQAEPLSAIRTQIDDINVRLIDSIASGRENETCSCSKPEAYSEEVWRIAIRTLASSCNQPSSLK